MFARFAKGLRQAVPLGSLSAHWNDKPECESCANRSQQPQRRCQTGEVAQSMRNEIAVRLFSRKVLSAESSEEQIAALSHFDNGVFCPEVYGRHEPLRMPFDPDDVHEPVLGLSGPQGAFLCKKGRPLQVRGAIWNRYYPPRLLRDDSGSYIPSQPAPTFCTHWTFEFDLKWARKIGVKTVCTFAEQMFSVSGSDFGIVTSLEDLEAKNYLHKVTRCGLDPADGVPGLYWISMFSAEYARWLRVDQIPLDIANIRRFAADSAVVQFGPDVEGSRDPKTLSLQQKAIGILGRRRFFDVEAPDRKLEVPKWARLTSATQVVN
jgi:hypothetical protein